MLKYFDWKSMSPMRKRYTLRLAGRCLVLIIGIWLLVARPQEFEVLEGWNFFKRFSILHVQWVIWVLDMIVQILPVGKQIPLGSQKLFKLRYVPVIGKFSREKLKSYMVEMKRSAGLVLVLWTALTAVIGLLGFAGVLGGGEMLLITALFYVCDLICVLIWCPFRLIMKNRCCTTCRIFNWDHMMMFSPMLFVKGFYSWSLFALAIGALLVWEVCVLLYPERFWDHSNAALQCSNCTDKLCTQYCRKLR